VHTATLHKPHVATHKHPSISRGPGPDSKSIASPWASKSPRLRLSWISPAIPHAHTRCGPHQTEGVKVAIPICNASAISSIRMAAASTDSALWFRHAR